MNLLIDSHNLEVVIIVNKRYDYSLSTFWLKPEKKLTKNPRAKARGY